MWNIVCLECEEYDLKLKYPNALLKASKAEFNLAGPPEWWNYGYFALKRIYITSPDRHILVSSEIKSVRIPDWDSAIYYLRYDYIRNICHDLRQIIQIRDTEKTVETLKRYPLAMSMSVRVPVLLPTFPNLLGNPSNSIHPLLRDSSLKLVAWLVSGIHSNRLEFRERLQASSLTHVDQETAQTY